MKKHYSICILLALFVASCQDGYDTDNYSSQQSIRVKGSLSVDSYTRTSYTFGENSVSCAWESGDTIALFSSGSTTPLLYSAQTSGSTTEFQALGSEIKANDDEAIYAWYPYQSSKSQTYPTVYLPSIRNQYYNGGTIPSDLDFIYSSAQVTDDELHLSFNHLFAFLRLRIATEVLSGYLGIRISCSGSDEDMAYSSATFDVESENVECNSATSAINYYIDSEVLSSNKVIDCYVAMLPLSASSTMNFSWIITSNASRITSIQLKKTAPATGFLAGHVYSLTIGDVEDEDEDEDEGGNSELVVSPTSVNLEASQSTFSITVTSDADYNVTSSDSWLSLTSDIDGTLTFTAEENTSYSERTATITVTAGSVTRTVTVTQEGAVYTSTDYSEDGKVYTLQTHTKGDGMKLFILGEAFSDRLIADGTYKKYVDLTYEAMFSEEPFASYKDYFDVYYVNVVSENEYLGGSIAFSTTVDDDSTIYDQYSKVSTYVKKLSESGGSTTNVVTAVLVNCNDIYTRSITVFSSSGFAAAYCITPEDTEYFKQIVHHEVMGHGFANLADEYEEYEGTYPYASSLATYQKKYYWYLNVDTTNDTSSVLWSYYLSDSNYDAEGLGIYEGAECYSYGVYRSRENSIMRDNTGGFNAPSRQEIYRRIITRSGGTYTFEDFLEYDEINCKAYSSGAISRSSGEARRGVLGAPPRIIIE